MKMGRNGQYRELTNIERRVAMMRAAGATQITIAIELESTQATVSEILKRPHVHRYLMMLSGLVADGIADTVEFTNEKIKIAASEAFDTNMKVMRDLDDLGDVVEDSGLQIKAKLGAALTAQDILDRAGNRAPTKVVQTNLTVPVPVEMLEHMANVLREAKEVERANVIDVEPEPSPQDSNEPQGKFGF